MPRPLGLVLKKGSNRCGLLAAGKPGNAIDDDLNGGEGTRGTGMLQCSPWLPLDGQQAVRVLDELRDVFHGHALDCRINLKLVSGRELVATVSAPLSIA